MHMRDLNAFMDANEAAQLLRISPRTLRNRVYLGRPPLPVRVKGFRRLVWRRSEIEALLDDSEQQGEA